MGGKGREGLTVHPLPTLQPTTPQALPLARTWRGKISAGYSQGMVSHVAPKPALKTKVKVAAAAPNSAALSLWEIAAREKPPERNMDIPITMEPR